MAFRSPGRGLALAVALVLPFLAAALQLALWPVLSPFAWFFLYPAVFFSARIGGLWGGLGATVLSTVLVIYLFVPPEWSLRVAEAKSLYAAAMFLVMGVLFSVTHERLWRAQQRAVDALEVAGRVNEELRAASAAVARLATRAERTAVEPPRPDSEERRTETQFRRFVELAPLPLAYFDRTGTVVYVNHEFVRVFGYTRDDIPTVDIWRSKAFPDEEYRCQVVTNSVASCEEARRDGTAVDLPEARVVCKDGSVRHVEASAVSVDEGLLFLFLDITERKQAEKAGRERDVRYRLAVEGASLGTWRWDVRAGERTWSARCRELYGIPAGKPLNQADLPAAVHPDDWPRVERALKIALGDGSDFEAEYRVVHPDGSIRWVSSRGRPFKGPDGLPVHMEGVVMDVTPRKLAEEASRQSEARYRSLFDNMLDAVIYVRLIYDGNRPVDFVYLHVNAAFERLMGLKDVVGKRLGEVIPGVYETDPNILDVYDRVVRTGVPERFERYVAAIRGWFDVSVFRPEPGHAVAVFDVITQRKQAEAALRESKAKLEAALASMTDAVFTSDLEGNFIDFNDAFVTFHRFNNKGECPHSLAECSTVLELFQPDGALAMDLQPVPRALRGESATNAEYTLRRKDTGETWVGSYSFAPIRDKDGAIVGSVVTARDVTVQKHAEEALRMSEEHLRLAQEAAKAGSWSWDMRTGKGVWSDACWQICGVEPGSVDPSYEAWLTSIHPVDLPAVNRLIQKSLQNGTELYFEWRIRDGDGVDPRWLMARGCPVRDDAGRPVRYLGIVMDITERKRAEEALRASLAEKVALLSEVHHRVKNNLQIVASLLNLQATRAENREVSDALQDTRNRVYSIALLHESLYRSGHLARIDFSVFVADLCTHLLRMFGPEMARVTLEQRVERVGLPLEHSVPCGLIINELVSNALKHGFPDGRAGTVVVELRRGEGDDENLRLRVSDDGVGLPADFDVARVTSLGLRLVTNLSGQLGGQVDVGDDRDEAAGASFTVTFPAPKATTYGSEI